MNISWSLKLIPYEFQFQLTLEGLMEEIIESTEM